MDTAEFEQFLDQLKTRLAADPAVLGLITLGSTADASVRDHWSDHDFWIITKPGAQSAYRDHTTWLPTHSAILLTVIHGAAYRSVLLRSRHRMEYAVFDPEEARSGKLERYAVVFDREGTITPLAESIRAATEQARQQTLAGPKTLENLAMLVWSAHERAARGELLSAQRYLAAFAVDVLLDLLVIHGLLGRNASADRLDPRRRVEGLDPALAKELLHITTLTVTRGGVALLDVANARLRPAAPGLAWENAAVVRSWLVHAMDHLPS